MRVSAGQSRHALAPMIHEYLPAGQGMQDLLDEAPTSAENMPAEHARQMLLTVAPFPAENLIESYKNGPNRN